jgi:hypothetical protein
MGPLNTNAIDADGTLTTGIHAILNAGANALIASSTAVNGWALGVYGQQNPGVPGVNVLRDFTSHTINDKFAHLRSRRD